MSARGSGRFFCMDFLLLASGLLIGGGSGAMGWLGQFD